LKWSPIGTIFTQSAAEPRTEQSFFQSDETLNPFDENDPHAAYQLELPLSIHVWQRLPSGQVRKLAVLFCDESYGCVHELIKQTYGPGEYLIRPIYNGVLYNRRYTVRIAAEAWISSQKRIRMQNEKEAFNETSQSKKDKQISSWLKCLRGWWPFIKVKLSKQKCFLTFEDFISARRSLEQYLDQMEADEIELITSFDAYELFESHLQRLCPKREQNDDARFSDSPEETQRIEEMLKEINEAIKRFEKEQSEKNSLLLFLCALCLILLLVLILAPQPAQLAQQPTA
jgi:hypothetical protein